MKVGDGDDVEPPGGSPGAGVEDVKNKRLLLEMNTKYAVVLDGAKVRVMSFDRQVQQIGSYTQIREVPIFMDFDNFRNLYCNKFVMLPGKKEGESASMALGTWWLKHSHRREYHGLTFKPGGGGVVDGKFNLWRGWGVVAKAGDWSLMREHIRIVMACEDEKANKYIINWLAWMIQHPDRSPEVALVFKGGRGVGKGALGNTICRIFGQHSVHISDAKHLVGFNAHLRATCFLFADEAYWPGDKSAEGNLKRLITEPTLLIEGKGRDAVISDNMLHVMIASNEDWVVPAGEHERRFVAYDVSDAHQQDHGWFGAIYKQLENGGYGAMLHDLLTMDLGSWSPRQISERGGNGALLDQQRRSLEPFDVWWVELLESGTLEGADPEKPHMAVSNEYQREVQEVSHNGNPYTRYIRQRGLFDQARAIEPRLRARNDHLLGRYLAKQGCDNIGRVLKRRGWTFPALGDLRAAWMKRFPEWVWRDPALAAWRYEEDNDGGTTAADKSGADHDMRDDDVPF